MKCDTDLHEAEIAGKTVRSGDWLVYGNGERVRIVNFPAINGRPGIQLDDKKAMCASDRFQMLERIDRLVANGVFSIESGRNVKNGGANNE